MPKKYEIFPYLASFLAEAHKDSSGGVPANKSKLSPMGVRGQKVPRLLEFKRCKGCQGIKGAKGAWVKSSEGLLGGRVFSRTHLRSSLTPEEGPSCLETISVF